MVFGEIAPGYTGLKPIGPSCYMNSVLQVYSNTRMFHNFYLLNQNDIVFSNKYASSINKAFKNVLEKLWSGTYKYITPTELRRAINTISFIYRNNEHHDIQEFSINLNNWIDNELKAITGASLTENVFSGIVGSQISCNNCNYVSTQLENFVSLSLPILEEPCLLQDCLTKFLENEHIPDAKCSSCEIGSYYRACHLKQMPINLVITLKRFSFGPDATGKLTMLKNNVPVKYGEKLIVNNLNYYLYAIISHQGTLDAGHYYSVIRNLRNGKWLIYDDQVVEEALEQNLEEYQQVYMLFFNREDEEQNIYEQFKYNKKKI